MKFIEKIIDQIKPHFEKGGKLQKLFPLFEAADTFTLTSASKTKSFPHIRDAMDMKRLMSCVILALMPPFFFGMYNTGYQALSAQGLPSPVMECFFIGLKVMIPIIITSYAVGGFWEVLFAVVRRHEINEGFFVTGFLFPLVLPPTIPLWQVALGISFGVVIGKEVFGGTGMNILNPALTARALVFFAYPGSVSGDRVWRAIDVAKVNLVDGYSGATPLLALDGAALGASPYEVLQQTNFSWLDCFLGLIPGIIGETSTLACLIGAGILLIMGVANWRIMVGMFLGALLASTLFNALSGPGASAMMKTPFYYHIVLGGFFFGMVYMATDPVSAPSTQVGRWIYGFLIGLLVIIIRVLNPAYPEGVMLAILFMNVFAPLIDHYCIQANIRKRELRRKEKAIQ